jgi:hypothetical protein
LEKSYKDYTILKDEDDEEGGRLGFEEFVKEFELYSNPNDGKFDVIIDLAEESPITLSIWSVPLSNLRGRVSDTGERHYEKHVDLRPLPAGNYILRLDHARGSKYIRFIVN